MKRGYKVSWLYNNIAFFNLSNTCAQGWLMVTALSENLHEVKTLYKIKELGTLWLKMYHLKCHPKNKKFRNSLQNAAAARTAAAFLCRT